MSREWRFSYIGLDNDILWSIIETNTPPLLQDLKAFRDR
jgi:uncharacterized protein with HEPN domain